MRWLAASALAMAPVPAAAQDPDMTPYAGAVEGATRAFAVGTQGDWQFACDNSATCTILGYAGSAGVDRPVVAGTRSLAMRIEIGPDGQVITIALFPDRQAILADEPAIDWNGPFAIDLLEGDGPPLLVRFGRTDFWFDNRFSLFRRLLADEPLAARDPATGAVRLRLPHTGFRAVIDEIDRRQAAIRHWRRVALPGDAPVTIRRAVPIVVSGVPPVSAAQMDWCGSGIDARDLLAFDLGEGWQLWQHRCPAGSLVLLSRFFVVEPGSSRAQVLRLPRAYGFTTQVNGATVPEAVFDFDFGVLRSFDPAFAGRTDCGRAMTWGWTDNQFVLLERRIAITCGGNLHPDWLVVWKRHAVMEDGDRP